MKRRAVRNLPGKASPLAPLPDTRTTALLRSMLAAAAAIGILCSVKLWIGSYRLFPPAPVWHALPQPPFPLDLVLLAALLASLIGIIVTRRSAIFIRIFLGIIVALVALDQSRLQPWMVQYAVMLGALLLLRRESTEAIESSSAGTLHACRGGRCLTGSVPALTCE